MADYNCFPLWEASPGMVGNINPASLPISDVLQKKLLVWASRYDAILNIDDPAKSMFSSADAEDDFIAAGKDLVARLQKELGESFLVIDMLQ